VDRGGASERKQTRGPRRIATTSNRRTGALERQYPAYADPHDPETADRSPDAGSRSVTAAGQCRDCDTTHPKDGSQAPQIGIWGSQTLSTAAWAELPHNGVRESAEGTRGPGRGRCSRGLDVAQSLGLKPGASTSQGHSPVSPNSSAAMTSPGQVFAIRLTEGASPLRERSAVRGVRRGDVASPDGKRVAREALDPTGPAGYSPRRSRSPECSSSGVPHERRQARCQPERASKDLRRSLAPLRPDGRPFE
jgi:hypothetical protein